MSPAARDAACRGEPRDAGRGRTAGAPRDAAPDARLPGRVRRRRRRGSSASGRSRRSPPSAGTVVEDPASGFCGAVVRVDVREVTLEDRHGRHRVFPLRPAAFLVDGRPATLVVPPRGRGGAGGLGVGVGEGREPDRAHGPGEPDLGRGHPRRGARRDACGGTTCGWRVWSSSRCTAWTTSPPWSRSSVRRRTGGWGSSSTTSCEGSKETRAAHAVAGPDVLVTGHPFVDVWQAVKPSVVGIRAWPAVPRGTDWKTGVCAALRWGDPADGARRVLGGAQLPRPGDAADRRGGAADRLRDRDGDRHHGR